MSDESTAVPGLDDDLRHLAEAYQVATEYWDWQGQHVEVPASTVVTVLGALGVDASTPQDRSAALSDHRLAPWRRMLPPTLVVVQGQPATVDVHVPDGAAVSLWVDLEDGGRRDDVHQTDNGQEPREIDGGRVGEATFALPPDLPLGYHTLSARCGDDETGTTATTQLIVTPTWVGMPDRTAHREWGLATQLYSVRSAGSWGVGDLVDLADLATWSGTEHGAGYVLINPLHAAEPTTPMEPSPYLPTSRRFTNPIYLRIERVPEFAQLGAADRAEVDRLRDDLAAAVQGRDTIDRNAVWEAKRAALEVLFRVPRSAGRELALAAYRQQEGQGLTDYATWCALAEVHGSRTSQWGEALGHPQAPAVAAFREAHPDRVDFHAWLQWLLDEQLAQVQTTARRAGMSIGVMHDLAVGVHPDGADAWALQDVFAGGIAVGAPPDAYNQSGQSWAQPPWRPDRLAATAYAPFRRLVATVLRNAGGVRIDHIIGLFRLWWIPDGCSPKEGTYVRYDHQALIGILALEAHRAGAVVVGEDLGTVEPMARDHLRGRGILGTSILWFEYDLETRGPLRAERWREYCMASVTTHDLPPTAGYLDGEHIRLRDRLGVLTRSVEEELRIDEGERQGWLDELRRAGVFESDGGAGGTPSGEETVLALHRYLTRTPSRLLCVALTDAVGDRRTQNQPGTVDEYPNWRVPLTGPDGAPMLLEDVFTSKRAAALARVVREH